MTQTGKVKTTLVLTRPDETIVREEPVKFEKDDQLSGYCMLQLAKIRSEGGILEMKSPFEMELIPIERIVSARVEGIKDLIQSGDEFGSAVAEAEFAKKARTGGITL